MKDYIDNYREAYDREFSDEGDEDIRKAFWKTARIEINGAKRVGLIQEMGIDEYLESNYKSYSKVSEETRRVIQESNIIPARLLADHFKVSLSAIHKIRANHKKQ